MTTTMTDSASHRTRAPIRASLVSGSLPRQARPRADQPWVPVTSYLWLQRSEDDSTMALGGEIDLLSGELVARTVRRSDATTVRLDLARVTFIDIAGLRAILEATHELAGTERRLVVTNVPRVVRRLLLLTSQRLPEG